jgi:hypothetical protein
VRDLPPVLRSVSAAKLADRLHAERRGEPFVVHVDGDGRQRIVELGRAAGALSIGRGSSSDVALPWDGEVSRVHAILERVGGEWTAQRRVLDALCRPFVESPVAVPPSNREIADELVVTVETVKTHLRALFELFGVPDIPQNRKRAELARRALEWGVLPT